MDEYIVRGPNWSVVIELPYSGEFIEAATRAVELITNSPEDGAVTVDGDKPRVSSIIQVSTSSLDPELDIDLNEFDINDYEALTEQGDLQFLYTPVILANAGLFSLSEQLSDKLNSSVM